MIVAAEIAMLPLAFGLAAYGVLFSLLNMAIRLEHAALSVRLGGHIA